MVLHQPQESIDVGQQNRALLTPNTAYWFWALFTVKGLDGPLRELDLKRKSIE